VGNVAYIVPYLKRSPSLDAIVERIGARGDLCLILVEDVPEAAAPSSPVAQLQSVETESDRFVHLRNRRPLGYTRSVNAAIGWALANRTFDAFWIVNDDVQFVRGIPEIVEPPDHAGMVGVLSDRAGYQSIAYSLDESGDYLYPDIPPGLSAERYDAGIAQADPRYVPVPLVHGFCFWVSRESLARIGPLDERGFAFGYGSDYDFSLRALAAGLTNYVYTGAYVAHRGASTAGRATRRIRTIRADFQLRKAYGEQYQRAKFVTRRELNKQLANYTSLARG
jgi:GT2 family glycosyltransferase